MLNPIQPSPDPAPKPSDSDAPLVDGLVKETKAVSPAPAKPLVADAKTPLSKAKRTVLFGAGVLYAIYALWCFFLVTVLPDVEGTFNFLKPIGLIASLAGFLAFTGIGLFLLQRTMRSDVSVRSRQRGLIRIIGFSLPGILLSVVVPVVISREPTLPVDITDPLKAEDFVAPLSVTFSVQRAVDILQRSGNQPMQYSWDTDGDGKANDQTVVPTETVVYGKQGVYKVSVAIRMAGGQSRTLTRSFVIPQAVFSVTPPQPIVQQSARFSVANLLTDPKTLKEVHWDFDGDGTEDEVSKSPETLHTYYAVGTQNVSALVMLQSNSQVTYRRTVTITQPPALPFPMTLTAQPKNLIGPVPFGVLFTLQTDQQLQDIQWDFGDGKQQQGPDLTRVGHSFEKAGIYSVTVKVHDTTGTLATLTMLVRATEVLQLSDLSFDGTPPVTGKTINGEAPLNIQLTAKTSVPLIQFSWESTESGSFPTGATLQTVYRKEGTYTITLIAQDPDGKAMRMPLTVNVDPPSAEPSFSMQPDGGVAPLEVTFDASDTFIPPGESIAGFEWRFGDETSGTVPELGAARVRHTYTQPGQFIASLKVVMASGKTFSTQKTIVVRKPTLSACITSSRTTLQAGKGAAFDSSCSTGSPTTTLWDIRYDAQPDTSIAQSTDPNFIHVFDTPGNYTVSLQVKDQYGNQDQKSVAITVTP